ncbi:MAG: uncharacterized protein A8A55_0247 [Amphiamblys sp. WSBS2006]|nr:MAG: uncharacterized protein A8A55_0247 [Amphiamblys sp. WSBS2006]
MKQESGEAAIRKLREENTANSMHVGILARVKNKTEKGCGLGKELEDLLLAVCGKMKPWGEELAVLVQKQNEMEERVADQKNKRAIEAVCREAEGGEFEEGLECLSRLALLTRNTPNGKTIRAVEEKRGLFLKQIKEKLRTNVARRDEEGSAEEIKTTLLQLLKIEKENETEEYYGDVLSGLVAEKIAEIDRTDFDTKTERVTKALREIRHLVLKHIAPYSHVLGRKRAFAVQERSICGSLGAIERNTDEVRKEIELILDAKRNTPRTTTATLLAINRTLSKIAAAIRETAFIQKNTVGTSSLNKTLEALGEYYTQTECYCLNVSVERALKMNTVTVAGSSTMVDDVFFLLRKTLHRSLQTHVPSNVRCVLEISLAVLNRDLVHPVKLKLGERHPHAGQYKTLFSDASEILDNIFRLEEETRNLLNTQQESHATSTSLHRARKGLPDSIAQNVFLNVLGKINETAELLGKDIASGIRLYSETFVFEDYRKKIVSLCENNSAESEGDAGALLGRIKNVINTTVKKQTLFFSGRLLCLFVECVEKETEKVLSARPEKHLGEHAKKTLGEYIESLARTFTGGD